MIYQTALDGLNGLTELESSVLEVHPIFRFYEIYKSRPL